MCGDIGSERLMADRYQVEVVQCSVEDAVLTLLTLETCGSILVSSFGSGLTRVQSESREFALRKFDDFSKSPGFMEIDEEVLGSLLDDDGLTTEKEERVFEAVVRWMKSDGELRGKELLRKIRFPHMDALYLADITSSQVLDDVGLDGLLLDSSVLKSIPRHLWAGRRLRFLDPKVLVPRGKVRWEDFARGGERRLAVRGHVHSVAVHGGYVCGGLLDGTILIWSRSTMDHERTLVGHSKTVWALLSTGGWLVSGGSDHTVRVWDVAAGRCEGVLEGHTGIVTCLAADGARLMSGSLDGTVRVWRAEGVAPAWRCEHLLDALGDQLGGLVAWGGRVAGGAGDGDIRVWDVETGLLERTLRGHAGHVWALAVAGRRLASSSLDKTVRVWCMETWGCLQAVEAYPGGSPQFIFRLAVEGQTLIGGSNSFPHLPGEEYEVRVWDLEALRPLHAIRQPAGAPVFAVASDGGQVWAATGKELAAWGSLCSGA